MSTTFSVSTELTTINCGQCGGTYAIQEKYRVEKYQVGGSWNCPYCKVSWGYVNNNENATLKKQLEEANARAERERVRKVDALAETNHFRKSRDGMKGALVSTQKRVKNGVCPCCKRTFSCLADHMASKHPDYAVEKSSP